MNIPLTDVDFRERMRGRHGLPVAIDNDGNAAAIAEWRTGAARGASNVVMLTLGTGIGGGLILGGRPYRGATGSGAELGHIVIEFDGPLCGCGGRGHFEAVASGKAAGQVAQKLYGPEAEGPRPRSTGRVGRGRGRSKQWRRSGGGSVRRSRPS